MEEFPRVCFQQDNKEYEDEAKPPSRPSKKIKAGKAYKSGMEYNTEWDDATKKAWTTAYKYKVHCKKHTNSMETKQSRKAAKKRKLLYAHQQAIAATNNAEE